MADLLSMIYLQLMQKKIKYAKNHKECQSIRYLFFFMSWCTCAEPMNSEKQTAMFLS